MRRTHTARYGVACACLSASIASAFEIETGNPDVKLRWDTTVKYTLAARVRSQAEALISGPLTLNADDGDRDFDRGIVSNRLDVFSEADLSYRNFGVRVSGAAWYDLMYFRGNANDSPSTVNAFSVPYNEFTKGTQSVNGTNAEVLDAFLFGSGRLGSSTWSLRAGRFAFIWGESLFFGTNGIATAQAPNDVVKLLSVPNSLFKETIRPVGQAWGQVQFTPEVALAGYYQYEWARSRLPGVGSYFSTTDVVIDGGERILLPTILPNGRRVALFRGEDVYAQDSGQGGLALRFRLGGADYGLYAVRWHSKAPFVYTQQGAVDPATGRVGRYFAVYPQNIWTFGASIATSIGDAAIGGEISTRRNMPLPSLPAALPPGSDADNDSHPMYAVGNSVHAQASVLWNLYPNFLARSSTFIGEIAFNRRTAITKNPQQLDPNATTDAGAVQVVYEPEYRQVAPGLDMTVPVGLSYGLFGRSSVVQGFSVQRGGNMNIGITGTYLETWRASLVYTHYYGGVSLAVGGQALHDRDYISLSIRSTF